MQLENNKNLDSLLDHMKDLENDNINDWEE